MLSHPAVFIKTMNLLQCFKKSFSENMQVSAIDDTCEISEMFKTAILKNNQGEPVLSFIKFG